MSWRQYYSREVEPLDSWLWGRVSLVFTLALLGIGLVLNLFVATPFRWLARLWGRQ